MTSIEPVVLVPHPEHSRMIDERPVVVDERSRIRDFEGDLIVGRHGLSAIGTLVDRSTQCLRLVHLPDARHGEATAAASSAAVSDLPMPARKTLTWDQGAEMAGHDLIAHLFPEGIYFAHPGSPWQRGTNENTNGLVRQFFPKGTDLAGIPNHRFTKVQQLLNDRPRKSLGYRTPNEVLASRLKVAIET